MLETMLVAATLAAGNPLTGKRLFVDPGSNAHVQAESWRSSRPEDARALDKIARNAQADWFTTGPGGSLRRAVEARVSRSERAGALAILVAYYLPGRDCGGYSSGGATTAAVYRAWIRSFAAGIGTRNAAVVVEPDGLAALDCMKGAARMRLSLLRFAVSTFSTLPRTTVYLDAGHPAWHPPTVTAARLRSAGVARARGFSLNVSNFRSTAEVLRYGAQVSRLVGGKHFVVDTSRNGRGPFGNEWCNPPGRALGRRPTTRTGSPLADAYLWVKRPGESDGTCRGGPAAGEWWPEYALGLARRASW